MKLIFLVFGLMVPSLVFGTLATSVENDGNYAVYNGYQVFRAFPSKSEQYDGLHNLEESAGLDFWTDIRRGRPVDIMISPEASGALLAHLAKFGIPHKVFISDVGKMIKTQDEENGFRRAKSPKFGWESYHTIDEIQAFLYDLAAEYPGLAEVQIIGKSFEGRNMTLIKISTGGSGKRSVFIDGNIHAREWISPAVVTYIVNELVLNAHLNLDILSKYDFYIVPNVNPDGYAYTHSSYRLWRKTRSDYNSTSGCIGADANRNWGYKWGDPGASPEECDDTYMGRSLFSESENAAISNFISSHAVNWEYFLTFHSYSQYCLIPFADGVLPPDYEELIAKANKFAEAVKNVANTIYTVGNWQDLLYTSSGTSQDWAKGVANIKYSYTIELRDKGNYGFLLPPDQIEISGRETWAGVKALLE